MQNDFMLVALFAFGGGFADASSILRFHTFTGHVTGNLVLLSLSVASAQWADVLLRVVAVVCFALCTAVGLRLGMAPRRWLWIITAQLLLILGACALQTWTACPALWGVVALCCSLGLQNGAFTSVAGVSVHSTFVSGDLTSLIRTLMQRNKPETAESGKVRKHTPQLLCVLVASFVLGALVAALLSHAFGIWLPCLVLFPLSLGAFRMNAITRQDTQ